MSDKSLKELIEVFSAVKEPKLMESFLRNILTPAELDEIAKRLQIFKMLHKGVPQRMVAKKLGVSIGTISRGSRELKYGEKGIAKVLDNFLGI
ncbi:MAG: YerC/YecD family TrpR-related protein [Candidatus Peregrinibacteria bacterium]